MGLYVEQALTLEPIQQEQLMANTMLRTPPAEPVTPTTVKPAITITPLAEPEPNMEWIPGLDLILELKQKKYDTIAVNIVSFCAAVTRACLHKPVSVFMLIMRFTTCWVFAIAINYRT